MGLITLQGFRDSLVFDLLNRDDLTDAWLDQRINQAYVHLCYPSVHTHVQMQDSEDITLIQNQMSYDLSTTSPDRAVTYQIIAVYSAFHLDAAVPVATTEKLALLPRDVHYFDRRTLTTGSRPRWFAIDGEWIHLDPVPDATAAGTTLRLRTWREPAALTLATQTTTLPAIWDEVLQLGAKWRGQRDLDYLDKAELSKQNFAAMLNEYAERQDIEARENWGHAVMLERGESVMELT